MSFEGVYNVTTMRKKKTKQALPVEQYFRCINCQTIFISNPGICPKCKTILKEGSYEEVITKSMSDEIEKQAKTKEERELILARSVFIPSIAMSLLVTWIPFFGAAIGLICTVVSIFAFSKVFRGKQLKLASIGLAVSILGLAVGLVIMFVLGSDFLNMIRNP